MANQQSYRNNSGGRSEYGERPANSIESLDTSRIQFKQITADLFDAVAKQTAQNIAANAKSNKPTQLRKFYDEIVMWDQKITLTPNKPEKLAECLPFIKMLNAKVAYAEGRKTSGQGLVDSNYVTLISTCLQQVDSPETLHTFKLFMEAFMGFYKQVREKD